MRNHPRNDAFSRCVRERYAPDSEDEQEETMEIRITDLQIGRRFGELTLDEVKDFCRSAFGHTCYPNCPFKGVCGVSAEAWDLDKVFTLTPSEHNLMNALHEAGAVSVGRGVYGDPYWGRDEHTHHLLPDGAFPSLMPGMEVEFSHAACVEKEAPQ